MVFSSSVFLFIFLPLVVLIYYNPFVRGRKFRNAVLLIASIGFYAWGEPLYVFLMLLSIAMTYVLGLVLGKVIDVRVRKLILILSVAYHVGTLFVFKYLSFVAGEIGLLIDKTNTVDFALPIGISFYTFQLMSYLFDVYYGKVGMQRNILQLTLYVCMFPQLVAGPIVRYDRLCPELTDRNEEKEDFICGTERFVYGLGKKVLLSNYLAYYADLSFNAAERTLLLAWIGAIAYTLQIYFDFSGYSDMAIGLGRIFGFHYPENFHYPYISKSVTEFWRRWHISLGSWFRDYVYIPMGGNRTTKRKWVRNIFVVWALTGIWHGANWTFLIWGMLYFVVLIIEKNRNYQGNSKVISHIYTMFVVTLAWVIFRAETITSAFVYYRDLAGYGGVLSRDSLLVLHECWVIFVFGILFSMPIYARLMENLQRRNMSVASKVRSAVVLVVFFLSLVQVISMSYQPFIYFNF